MKTISIFLLVVECLFVVFCVAANNPPCTILNMSEGEYNACNAD